MTRNWGLLVAAMVLAGCTTSGQHAPVWERSTAAARTASKAPQADKRRPAERDTRPRVYTVQKGDTLYSIAFNYGLDYHELAELNGIQDANLIRIGQQINLFAGNAPDARPPAVVETQPMRPTIKEQPKLAKYAYSEAAVAQAEGRAPQEAAARPAPVQVAKPEPKPAAEVKPEPKPEPKPVANADDDALEWSMPTQGKVVGRFSEADNRKGVEIAGKLGQPVFASAPGKVVYSGSGLRGYGKLLIIKHNNTYLSAYAHNDQLLVKEGQTVTRGQKIAEMGNTDSDQVALHFEVRRFGKPVD
ncbi:MAG: peptidoglycan DD-metalloendopeptidase family protein, partial [Gallionella sp.]|nr:peptidoglycan DD-metalloendopeptidase family protein [Gallionella sp.]